MNELSFRNATYDDIESIMEIVADAQESLRGLHIDQWQNGYPNAEVIKTDIDNKVGIVGLLDGKIVAFAAIVFTGEPAYDDLQEGNWLSNEDYVVLHRLCVRKSATRHGIAGQIMTYIETEALKKGVKSFKIDTHLGNIYMMDLLKKSGFTYCGIVYYDHGKRWAFEKLLK